MNPAVLCSGGCRASNSVSRLQTVTSSGTTPLFDALILGADFTSHHRRAGVRPVLILFSDGSDTISLHPAREALESVLAGEALIYSVDIGTSRNPSSSTTFLRQVSEATVGRYFSLRSPPQDSAATVLNAALDDLRASLCGVLRCAEPSSWTSFAPPFTDPRPQPQIS